MQQTALNGGLEYERRVREVLKRIEQNNENFSLYDDDSGAFNAHVPDVKISYKGRDEWIEIKMDGNAQMGGTSILYNDGSFSFLEKKIGVMDRSMIDLVLQELTANDMSQKIEDLFSNLRSNDNPVDATIRQIPFTVARESWVNARKQSLLMPINLKIKNNEKFIIDHYASKGCNYIQIGRCGLFYMNANPLGLDIPKLECDIQLEIRLRRSGSVMNKTHGFKTASVNLALQGRMKTKCVSSHTLDDYLSTLNLFGD